MWPTARRPGIGAVLLAASTLALSAACVDQRCFRDDDCPSPRVCDRGPQSPTAGRCVWQCVGDADCTTAGFVCRDHRCVAGGAPALSCPADMAAIEGLYCVDLYEASRPDATSTSPGADGSRAVSRAGVLPWQVADNATAAAACAAAGKRLCTGLEWLTACAGPEGRAYSYGGTYDPTTCNGIDTFGPGGFHLVATGTMPGCVSADGVFDLNGNLWEHTAGGDDRTVRGGAYNCSDSRAYHRCDYVPGVWTPSARGFRCCAEGTPVPPNPADAAPDSSPADGAGGCVEAGAGEDAQAEPADAPAQADSAQNDGAIVSGCPEDMLLAGSVCVDRYEASRPDATATSQGTTAAAATSRPGVLPWQPVTLPEAREACGHAGKRLCRAEEWTRACGGPSGSAYSYGDAYSPTVCNGIDAYCSCATCATDGGACPFPHCYQSCGAAFHVMPTASFPECLSAEGLHDVNGNLWELVDSDDGLEHFRGGAFNCLDSEALHRCDYDATWGPSARGFRCCQDPSGS